MPADQVVFVGHSNGGLMARHASPFLSPLGIVTVGTGHTGVPLSTQVGAVLETLTLNTFFLADVLLLTAYPLVYGYSGIGPAMYVVMSGVAAALAAQQAYVYGLNLLADWEPFRADNLPGSTFLSQLPTGGPHRYSLSVVDASGAAPWSLALDPTYAQYAMYLATGAGVGLFWSAIDLYDHVDWLVFEAAFVSMYISSAVSLANLLINLPGHWCVLVGGGVCVANDGFVATGNQAYPSGQNETISDAAHTKQTGSAGVLTRVEARVRAILGL